MCACNYVRACDDHYKLLLWKNRLILDICLDCSGTSQGGGIRLFVAKKFFMMLRFLKKISSNESN